MWHCQVIAGSRGKDIDIALANATRRAFIGAHTSVFGSTIQAVKCQKMPCLTKNWKMMLNPIPDPDKSQNVTLFLFQSHTRLTGFMNIHHFE